MNIDIDISGTVLKTRRLILRPWRETDLDDLYEYASVDGVGQMAGWLPHKDKEESFAILQMFIDGKKTFAIEHEGKVIGSLGIEKYDTSRMPEFDELRGRELGYVLSKEYWGQGLTPEAVKEVIRWLFEEQQLQVIFCSHFTYNLSSRRVMDKCGFADYCETVHETRFGTDEPAVTRILRREDWEKIKSNFKK